MIVGQDGILRPIGNRPGAVNPSGVWLRLRCSVGQTCSLRRICNPPELVSTSRRTASRCADQVEFRRV